MLPNPLRSKQAGRTPSSRRSASHRLEPLEPRCLLTHALGDAFTVSQSRTDGNGGQLDVAADADGDFVVVWVTSGTGGQARETRGRLYDRFGQPKGDEQRFLGGDRFPRVSMDANGDFVVVVEGSGRLFNSDGTPAAAAFGVGTNPDVAMEDNGDFVAVWTEQDVGVVAQRFNSAGATIGGQIIVEPSTGTAANFLIFPTVAMDANGDFVVVWMQGQQQGFKRVRARRYNNAGAAQGATFNVTPDPIDSFLVHPRVSMDDNGAFVITWPQDGTGSGKEVFVRGYNASGVVQGDAFQVNNDNANDQSAPDITLDADADFVVVWTDESVDPRLATARRFSNTGVAESNEFDVDFFNPFEHLDPVVAAEDNGGFVVAWRMFLGSELGIQIRARRFSPDETAPAAPSRPDLLASADTGRSTTDNITRDSTPAFAGSAEPGSIVTLLVSGVAAATDTVSSNGLYLVGVPASFNLADGVHSITVTATDDGGNVSPVSPALSVTLDTVAAAAVAAPDLSASSDTGISNTDNITADSTPTFTGTAEPNSIVKVFASGVDVSTTAFAQLGTTWSMTVSQLTDGSKSITMTQEDVAGNVSAPSPSLGVTIDTVAPVAAIQNPLLDFGSDTGVSNNDLITRDNTPGFSAPAPAGVIVRLYAGTVEIGVDDFIFNDEYRITSSPLPDGAHAITARFEDRAGNETPSGPALNIVVDTIAPAPPTAAPDLDPASDTGISSTDNITRDNTPLLKGALPPDTYVRILADNFSVAFGGPTVTGQYALSPPFSVGEGPRSLAARFEDVAGNASPSGPAVTLTIDTSPPAVRETLFELLTGHTLRFSFSEDLRATLVEKHLVLQNLTQRKTIDPSLMSVQHSLRAAAFTFPGLPGAILPDGNYHAELNFEDLTDVAGNPLERDGGFDFFVLAADANRDRSVGFNDLVALAQNYNRSGGVTFEDGDFDYDRTVGFNDLVALAQRYNTSLPAAAATLTVPPGPAAPVHRADPPVFNGAIPIRKPLRAQMVGRPRTPPTNLPRAAV